MHSPDSNVAFNELLAYLRQRGFTIGVGHYLRLQELLKRTGTDCSPQDLKTLLCPIFATNQTQQKQFYRAFDEYYGLFHQTSSQRVSASRAQEGGPLALQHTGASPGRLHIWPYILGATIILLLIFYFSISRIATRPVGQSNANEQDLVGTRPIQSDDRTAQQNSNQEAAVEAPTPPPATDAQARLLSFYSRYRSALRATGITAPLIILLFYEWYRLSRRKVILQKQKGKKPPFNWPLRVQSSAAKLFDSDQFYDAAKLMRRRQADEFYQLDIDRTIAATVESMGYPDFRYKFASKPPEYLILIERSSFRDHQAQFFNELTKSLEREGIFTARYFYDGDPRICCKEGGEGCVHLVDLQNKFAGHRLLIIGTGEELIDPVTGAIMPWAKTFSPWQNRAVLTPEDVTRWGLRENSLAGQFVVRPATSQGLRASVESFEATLRSGPYGWKKDVAGPPQFDELSITETVASLRAYLGEEVFQWLCACAVYTELQWDLTLYLGSLSCLGKDLIREDNLLKMVRLPWFRTGSMPDDLRWRLISELDREKERAVRGALIELLEKNPPPEETFAANSYELNLVVQRWLSFRDRKRRRELIQMLKTGPRSQLLQDYTLMRFLESEPKSSLSILLPRKFRKLFYQNGIPAFGLKTGFRVLLTLTLAATIWLVMRPDPAQSGTSPLQRAAQKFENLTSPKVRREMIAIPGGTFQMGRDDGPVQEAPAHVVTVSDFYMDKTEVTNAEYAEFVNETKHTPPSYWVEGALFLGQEQWPVNNVSLDDAKAFAAWRSKRDGVTYRLPTEEEWEYAARNGDQGNLYPWGNSWGEGRASVQKLSLSAVGSFPDGNNRWGVVDLIGNVWEWTSSTASIYRGGANRLMTKQDIGSYVMRGGSYLSDPSGERAITATFRDWIPESTRHSTLGFRLVRSGSRGK
ncbi:MAG TPA: formylglycine-generating enzyme family protein [Pyrinomonadaceae bacterium]|jgi:formylglycine-generating enzyme required for sulfatase activity|nr:formylglycine-generating enzyme family protein [Pyrinomonadaceae bacterium]